MDLYGSKLWIDDIDIVLQGLEDLNDLSGKSVLVTGATGLIGSAVIDILVRYNDTHIEPIYILAAGRSREKIDRRFGESISKSYFEYINFDASKEMNWQEISPDYIIHAAGDGSPAIFAERPVEIMMVHILGLRAVLELAKHSGSRLLFISSSEIYGKGLPAPYKEENQGVVDNLNPRACYPNAKRTGETLCACYGKEYGVNTVIVRPGHVYGPYMNDTDTRAASQFLRAGACGEPIVMKSEGNQRRSHCHTLDCASAILTILLRGESGEAYNISNRDSVCTVRQFAQAVADASGVEILFEEPTSQEKGGYNLMEDSSLDAQKLERLGWRGVFDLQRGVEDTLKVMKSDRSRC